MYPSPLSPEPPAPGYRAIPLIMQRLVHKPNSTKDECTNLNTITKDTRFFDRLVQFAKVRRPLKQLPIAEPATWDRSRLTRRHAIATRDDNGERMQNYA